MFKHENVRAHECRDTRMSWTRECLTREFVYPNVVTREFVTEKSDTLRRVAPLCYVSPERRQVSVRVLTSTRQAAAGHPRQTLPTRFDTILMQCPTRSGTTRSTETLRHDPARSDTHRHESGWHAKVQDLWPKTLEELRLSTSEGGQGGR